MRKLAIFTIILSCIAGIGLAQVISKSAITTNDGKSFYQVICTNYQINPNILNSQINQTQQLLNDLQSQEASLQAAKASYNASH